MYVKLSKSSYTAGETVAGYLNHFILFKHKSLFFSFTKLNNVYFSLRDKKRNYID